MKNIIPLRKDFMLKTNIDEVTSISLENTLNLKDNIITGDFLVSGDYKVSENSNTVEPFDIKIPVEIEIDEKYDTKKSTVDVDDFYYEIKNDNTLSISIDILIDHLEEKEIIEDLPEVNLVKETLEREEDSMEEEKRCIEEETIEEEPEIVENKINSIFSNVSQDVDNYVTYNVFIVREGDSLETIMDKYSVTEEELKKYNDLSNIKLGDKLIIPNKYEGN